MINIFNNISDKNIPRLLRFLEAHTFYYKKGSQVLSNFIEDNVICIVQSGYLQIIKSDYNGNATFIENLEENSVFGEVMTKLKNNDYQIVVKEDTKLIVIDYERILSASETHFPAYHEFVRNLLQIMAEKVKDSNERIEILTNKTIRNKLLAYFKMMSMKTGSKIVYLPSTLTDLSGYLAVDRSAMQREIKNLKDEGLIEIKEKRIKLLYYIN